MQPIPRRLARCSLQGELFEPGCSYVSVLDGDGNRKDYCLQCWKEISKPVQGHYWKGEIPPKKERQNQPDHNAFELFKSLSDPKIRYVLALYLQRKQQLVRRTQSLYEVQETGEIFDVAPVTLTVQEGESLGQVIEQLIHATPATSH